MLLRVSEPIGACLVFLCAGSSSTLFPQRMIRAVDYRPGSVNVRPPGTFFLFEIKILGGNPMSKKAAEHHRKASEHLTHAAHHHGEAAKHHDAGHHEKAAHHAHTARGHAIHARGHADEAAKAHSEEHGKK